MGERCGLIWRRYRRLTATGWPKRFPVAQFPNPPLLVALAGWLTGALTAAPVHQWGRAIFYMGLTVWAWGETCSGVNWVRRLIGIGIFIWVASQIARALPA